MIVCPKSLGSFFQRGMFARTFVDNTGKHQIVFSTGFTILSNFRVTESETGFNFSLLVRFQKLLDFEYFDVKHTFFMKNGNRFQIQ